MTDTPAPHQSTPHPDPTTPQSEQILAPKKKKRWIRRIVIGLSVVVVLLIVLVLLLPTIVSLSPVRSMVMSQVSGYLDGRAQAESWSVGWFSPLSVQGLRVYDKDNAMVLDIATLQTQATLLSLLQGDLNLGKSTASIDATKIIVYPDQTTNLHKIARLTQTKPKPKQHESASSIPDLKIDLTLQLTAGVHLVDEVGKPVTMLQVRPGSGGTIKIADINKGVDADLKLIYVVDAGTTSTVAMVGSVDVIENNQVAIDQLTAKLKLMMQNIDTAASKPLLVMAGVSGVEIGGVVNGQVEADLQPGQAGSIKGTPTITNVVFAHPAIADRYQASELSLPIDVARVIENGATRLKIDIRAIAPEITAQITGDIAESSIAQLQAQRMPGANGQIAIELTADPAKASRALPNTFMLLPGVTVTGGQVHAKTDVWLKPDSIVYGVSTSLNVSGTQNGKPIAIEPVTLITRGTVLDLGNPIQGLRDLSLGLSSQFATFNATGTSVTTVSGKGSADLGLLRQQLSQFSDLSNTQLAGHADIALANAPKAGAADAYALNLTLTLNDIKANLPDMPLIDLPFVKVVVESGYVLGTDTSKLIQQIDTTRATVVMGQTPDKPLADVVIVLSNIDLNAQRGNFDLQKATITSLAQLQKMIDPFVPQLRQQQIELTGGAAYVVTKGSADLLAKRITLDSFDFSAPNLRINWAGKLLIDERRVALSTAGQLFAGEQMSVDLSRFSFESAIATLTTNDKPLSVTLADAGLPRGSGTIRASVQLPQLNRIAQSLSTTPINTVTSGELTGDLAFANADGKPTVGFDGKIAALSIDATPIQNESITLALNAATTDAMDHANASANIKGSFVSLSLKNASILLKQGTPPLKMIESALIELGVPDANKAVSVAQALIPGLTLAYTPAGGIALTADIKPGQVDVDLKASRLSLTDPLTHRTYRFNPKKLITLQAALNIVGDDAIRSIRVNKLTGDLDLVQLSMPEPIVIDDPLGTPAPRGKVCPNRS